VERPPRLFEGRRPAGLRDWLGPNRGREVEPTGRHATDKTIQPDGPPAARLSPGCVDVADKAALARGRVSSGRPSRKSVVEPLRGTGRRKPRRSNAGSGPFARL